jgi:eukaryotic-like serine/threonine-protein kinase
MQSSEPMPLTIGTRVGPYIIDAPIGASGMAEVYRARDARLNRDVAIKVLPDLFSRDPDRLARFEREAQAVAALSHPGILAIHDFGTSGQTTYAVMELLGEGDAPRAAGRWTAPASESCRIRGADRTSARGRARPGHGLDRHHQRQRRAMASRWPA